MCLVIPRDEIAALLHDRQIQPFFTTSMDHNKGKGGGGGGNTRKSAGTIAGGGGGGIFPPGQGESAKARKLKQQASVFMEVIGDEVVGNKFDDGFSGNNKMMGGGIHDDMTSPTITTDYAMIVPALFALRALLERGWQPDHMPPEVISSLVHILCCAQTAATPNERIRVSEALTALLGAAIGIGPDASELVFVHLLAAQLSLSTVTNTATTAATADGDGEKHRMWRSPRAGGRDVVSPPVRGTIGLGFNSGGGGSGSDSEDIEEGELGIPSATASVIRLLAHVLYEEATTDQQHIDSSTSSSNSSSSGPSHPNTTGGIMSKSKYTRDINSVVFGHVFAASVYKEPLPGTLLPLRQPISSNSNTTTPSTTTTIDIHASAAASVINALSLLRGPVNVTTADTLPNNTPLTGQQTLALSPLRGAATGAGTGTGTGTATAIGNLPLPPGGVQMTPLLAPAPTTPGRVVPPTSPTNNISPARAAVLNAAVHGFGGMAAVNNTNNLSNNNANNNNNNNNNNANNSFTDNTTHLNLSSPRKQQISSTTSISHTNSGSNHTSQSPRSDASCLLTNQATAMLPEFLELLECVFRINRARRMEKVEEKTEYSYPSGNSTEQNVGMNTGKVSSASGVHDETSGTSSSETMSISQAIRRDLQQKLFEKANECFAMVPPYNAVSKKFDSATRGGRHIWQAGEPLAPGYLVDAMDREKSWFESYVTEIRPAMAPASTTTPPRANTPSRYNGYDVKVHFMGWGSKWDDWVPEKDVGTRIAPLNTRSKNWRADLFEGGLIEIKCNEDMVNQKWMWGKIIALNYEEGWVDVSYTFTNEPTGCIIVSLLCLPSLFIT